MDSLSSELNNDVTIDKCIQFENQQINNDNDVISELFGKESETGKFSPADEEEEREYGQQLASLINKGVKSRRKKLKKEESHIHLGATKIKTKKNRTNESKNVVKNYGKAIAAFCLSEVGNPYLTKYLQLHQLQFEDFKSFVINKKETIDSIETFRELLTPDTQYDSPTDIQSKRVFRDLSEVFIRDFAMNWIFSSRIRYKETHLNLRFKMLRRVMNPQNFTYLRSF
jgi:hypothetical protein